jgi:hypothetical protein
MITNTGKSIIGKYLLGQAPAFGSFLAIGCGATPLSNGDIGQDHSEKTNLDFEMFRVPISSKGFINENGIDKIVFTAELPSEERYEITEVGMYSAGSNPSAGAYDSKTIFGFTQTENWQNHSESSVTEIPNRLEALDKPQNDNNISVIDSVFQTTAENPIFYKAPRFQRYERCRFLNNIIMIQGDYSHITLNEESGSLQNNFVVESGSNHIHLTGERFDFTKNSLTDELRLSFSIVNKVGDSQNVPKVARVLIEFASSETENAEYARLEAEVVDDPSGTGYDLSTERYFVVKKQIQELVTSTNFTWNSVTVVRIYASVFEDTDPGELPSGDYYIALDALRLENVATKNPLYGLTGYSVVQNIDASAIIKNPNTSNYIEFRFSVDVSGANES